ncbi:MAG TPA: hypothetical protein EYG03_26340 [Planctomycetes bacterium]|nr:hypothetical protein [Fuerstiella sp.]HIK95480.1 hypothetical protein [Planctomycetota bacterium]
MIAGLVSNCWQTQLSAGEELEELIAEAERRKLRVIELRQGCLGSFESGDSNIPDVSRLSQLPQLFPSMCFNIAMSVPFLSPLSPASRTLLDAGRRAAVAVAGAGRPHLRLVDLESLFDVKPDLAHDNLVALAQSMAPFDGILSVEHSGQQWHGFLRAFRSARETLGGQQDRLCICFDPCNLRMTEGSIDLASATRSLSLAEVSMIHLKQCRDDIVLTTVSEGGVDWRMIGQILNEMEYRGPALFEVDSKSDVWQRIQASQEYLAHAGLDLEPTS